MWDELITFGVFVAFFLLATIVLPRFGVST